jgi:hypothetical protein
MPYTRIKVNPKIILFFIFYPLDLLNKYIHKKTKPIIIAIEIKPTIMRRIISGPPIVAAWTICRPIKMIKKNKNNNCFMLIDLNG